MRNLIFSIALLVGISGTLAAQDFHLPVSSKSEAAKTAYYEALKASLNASPKYGDYMKKAVQEDSTFFMCYALGAMEATADKNYDAAAKRIAKALAIKPEGLTKAESILRKLLVQWEKDPKSSPAKVMEELVAAYPKTPQSYDLAGKFAMYVIEDKPAALAYFQNMAKLLPKEGGVHNMIGYVYMDLSQMDNAKAAFDTYLRLAPNEANAYDSMAEYYLTVKDYTKSAEY